MRSSLTVLGMCVDNLAKRQGVTVSESSAPPVTLHGLSYDQAQTLLGAVTAASLIPIVTDAAEQDLDDSDLDRGL